MNLHIQRDRWVIIRNKQEILCGLAQQYYFKDIRDIGDTAIKTYASKNKAVASFKRSWWNAGKLIESGYIEFVNVVESIGTREFYKTLEEK